MAKKLYIGQTTFEPLANQVVIKGNILPQRLLLITNISNNTIIYNFADPLLGLITAQFDSTTESTIFTLVKDVSAMNSDDFLQVFIDDQSTEFTPAEDIIDPVGKIRISQPQNLIDTDFEYGLQSTKWETLQTVNNVPTIYSTSGDTGVSGISQVTAVTGSLAIKVEVTIAHGLEVGDPITVLGLSLYQAEGAFIVTSVPDNLTFFFELDVPATVTGVISGNYTSIVPSKFFEGSGIPVEIENGITTDEASPSQLTVNTASDHNYTVGTKVYLRNTAGPKLLTIADSAATAPDNRPYVDTVSQFSQTDSIDTQISTGRGSFLNFPVTSYDWNGTYENYFTTTTFPSNTDITWVNHNFRDNYTVLFSDPLRGRTNANLEDGRIYYVITVDADTIRLSLTENGTAITLSTMDLLHGYPKLTLAYKVEKVYNNIWNTAIAARYITDVSADITLRDNSGIDYPSYREDTFDLTTTHGLTAVPAELYVTSLVQGGDDDWWNGNLSQSEATAYYFTNDTGQQILPTAGGWTAYNGVQANGYTSSLTLRVGTDFRNSAVNLAGACYESNGRIYMRLRTATGRENQNFYGYYYQFRMTLVAYTGVSQLSEAEKNTSGWDLALQEWGLGGTAPTRLIAFQGVSSSSSYSFATDSFSYGTASNGFDNQRYSTSKILNTNSATQADFLTGQFATDLSNANWADSTQNSEIFYIFCNDLGFNKNLLYVPNHGVNQGTPSLATVTIDSARYAAGDRFGFANSTGFETTIAEQAFQVNLLYVSPSTLRMQIIDAPNTDDITKFASQFSMNYQYANLAYNTIYVENHKITASLAATYTSLGGTAIAPLVSGTDYRLTRVNDNRLSISDVGGGVTSVLTIEYGASINTATTVFIDVETPLGAAANTATIDSIEFRGNFSRRNEYVDITFDDGDNYRIGQFDDQGNSSTYVTSTTFSLKDVTPNLTNVGGKIGFNVEFDASDGVDRDAAGIGFWWQLRFTITASSSSLALTSAGTNGHQFLIENIDGAYDGIYTITEVPSSLEFNIGSTFTIPAVSYIISSIANDEITFTTPHRLITGSPIDYSFSGTTQLFDWTAYQEPNGYARVYVISTGVNSIKLATSSLSAINNQDIPLTYDGLPANHVFRTQNIERAIKGAGSVTVNGSTGVVSGSGTRFLSQFKRFDLIYLDSPAGYIKAYTVGDITSQSDMTISDGDIDMTGVDYYYVTELNPRPDGYSLHLPFDGGVDITAGTSPYSKIVRQTRKYFRYQSGKGIQTSFAVNFNPPKLARQLIQAAGTTATIYSQEQHNLKVGDRVIIEGATVSFGSNPYNGIFDVDTVPDLFSFTYELNEVPADPKAGGFPTYVRDSWSDSYVRAGMFDDQNGFFMEFDGQTLNMVRRSSTLQLAGSINCTKNSTVIQGINTSFSTQLQTGDRVVIRGQSYLINTVPADNRAIIQPAYKGASATFVKITKTVDVKTPQSEWNLDRADGNGFTGFILDTKKLQMAYMDYSWYGAGKIRYGFKDQHGHIRYLHEYVHNNRLTESYFRSGNLPARYEISNGSSPTTAPTLFHFGTSVIMDGTFDDDKAYQFTAQSNQFAYTAGGQFTFNPTGNSTFTQVTIDGKRVYVYNFPINSADITNLQTGLEVTATNTTTSEITLPAGTFITQVDITNNRISLSYPATTNDPTGSSAYPTIVTADNSFVWGDSAAVDLTQFLPLISVRLAPSVDSGLTGLLGEREIINRMQLALQQASVTSNRDIEIFLIQNPLPIKLNYTNAQTPSLSQIIKHSLGDTLLGGTTIYSTKTSAGSIAFAIGDLLEMGNSILGGDGVFPSGPDLLTLAVQPQDTAGISITTPFSVTGKISWSESQA